MSSKDSNNPPDDHDPLQDPLHDREAMEREQLLEARRRRQTGGNRSTNARVTVSLALFAASLVLLMVMIGPSTVMKFFGLGEKKGQETSQVDLNVDKFVENSTRLDFGVPAPEEPEKVEVDPNAIWEEKFKALQQQLLDIEKNKQPSVSNEEISKLLARYNDTMTKKLEDERKAMAEETARLRADAERAEAEKRRLEEEAKRMKEMDKESQKIDKLQRESNAIVIDEGVGFAGAGGGHGGEEDLDGLGKNDRFLKSQASSVVQTSVSQRLRDPSRTVIQGSVISAVLETAIDTELPGSLRAQVTRPVYSFDGSRVLMPSGTILIGKFSNDVDIAQKRVLIAWNRAITPDGQSVALGSTGTDVLGRPGTLGNVDNRYGTKFGAAILVSAISAIPNVLGGNKSSGSGTTVNIGGQMAGQAGGMISDQGSGILEKYLSLPPVIRIPQGEEIRIFVNRDLIFR